MNDKAITPLSMLGNELLGYATGQTVDFNYDEKGRLGSIVGRCRRGNISSEILLQYKKDTGHLWGVEVFSVGAALEPTSQPNDVSGSSFHIVEHDNRVVEILSDRTIHKGKKDYLREHLYRQYGWENGKLVTLFENQREAPSRQFEYDSRGRLATVTGGKWRRSILYNERGQIKMEREVYEAKLLHHRVIEFAGNNDPIQQFLVDADGSWALDSKYSVGEDVPDRISWDDSVAQYWFNGSGRLRLAVRGNLDEAQATRWELNVPQLAANPGTYLLDFNGSLDLTVVSPSGDCQLHVLKLSERVPEIVQVIRFDQGRITKVENCPGIGFNQCVALINAKPTDHGFRYAVPAMISDLPMGSVV